MYDITFEVEGKKSVERLPHAALMMQAGGLHIFPSCLFCFSPRKPGCRAFLYPCHVRGA